MEINDIYQSIAIASKAFRVFRYTKTERNPEFPLITPYGEAFKLTFELDVSRANHNDNESFVIQQLVSRFSREIDRKVFGINRMFPVLKKDRGAIFNIAIAENQYAKLTKHPFFINLGRVPELPRADYFTYDAVVTDGYYRVFDVTKSALVDANLEIINPRIELLEQKVKLGFITEQDKITLLFSVKYRFGFHFAPYGFLLKIEDE